MVLYQPIKHAFISGFERRFKHLGPLPKSINRKKANSSWVISSSILDRSGWTFAHVCGYRVIVRVKTVYRLWVPVRTWGRLFVCIHIPLVELALDSAGEVTIAASIRHCRRYGPLKRVSWPAVSSILYIYYTGIWSRSPEVSCQGNVKAGNTAADAYICRDT